MTVFSGWKKGQPGDVIADPRLGCLTWVSSPALPRVLKEEGQ